MFTWDEQDRNDSFLNGALSEGGEHTLFLHLLEMHLAQVTGVTCLTHVQGTPMQREESDHSPA